MRTTIFSLRHFEKILAAFFSIAFLLAASSASGTTVTWSLNPQNLDAPVGSPSFTFVAMGNSISATGYTSGDTNTPLGLYFKNQGADETGLGVAGTPDNELDAPNLQFIQLDLTSIIAQGFTNGQLEISSVQSATSDEFNFYGSDTAGSLGVQLGGTFDSTSDSTFVNIADFGNWNLISVTAASGYVLPMAFQAMTPIPEASTLSWLGALMAIITVMLLVRRRRRSSSVLDVVDTAS